MLCYFMQLQSKPFVMLSFSTFKYKLYYYRGISRHDLLYPTTKYLNMRQVPARSIVSSVTELLEYEAEKFKSDFLPPTIA